MAVSCNPSDLIEGAKCYSTCLLNEELSAIELWLLTQIAGTTTDVQTLLNNSACLENCVDHGNAEAIIVWLLTQIAGVNNDPNSLMSAARCIEACIIPEESKAIDVSLEVQIAGATTDLTTLLNNARCFRLCAADWRGIAIKIYLLAIKTGVSTDPATLIGSANCLLGCLNHDQLKLIETYLWCQIVNIPIITPQNFAGLAHWWVGDDLVGIVSDGQPVGDVGKEWVDRIAGIKGAQVSAGARPAFVQSWANGHSAIKSHVALDASPDFLDLSSNVIIAIGGQFSMIAVVNVVFTAGANTTFRVIGNSGGTARIGSKLSGASYIPELNSDTTNAGYTAWTGANLWVPAHALIHTRDPSNISNAWYNNAQQKTSICAGQFTLNRITVANSFGDNSDLFVSEIIHYSVELSAADRNSLYNSYLKPRYALT